MYEPLSKAQYAKNFTSTELRSPNNQIHNHPTSENNTKSYFNPLTKQGVNAKTSPPIQCLRDKSGLSPSDFTKSLMSKVYLYAELDGKPVGTDLFTTTRQAHAEVNLLTYLKANYNLANYSGKTLTILLSTSSCSSCFGTSRNATGCSEAIEAFKSDYGINVNVYPHHYYQPKGLVASYGDLDANQANDIRTSLQEDSLTGGVATYLSYIAAHVYNQQVGTTYNNKDILQLTKKNSYKEKKLLP